MKEQDKRNNCIKTLNEKSLLAAGKRTNLLFHFMKFVVKYTPKVSNADSEGINAIFTEMFVILPDLCPQVDYSEQNDSDLKSISSTILRSENYGKVMFRLNFILGIWVC